MAFGDASETRVAFIEETVFGTIDATPVWNVMRVTGEDMTGDLSTIVSAELRSDAEIADLIKVAESADVQLPVEISYGAEVHLHWQHMLRSTFAAASADTTVTALSVGATNTFDRAAGSFITDGFEVGMKITSSGFTDGANNRTTTVANVAATVLTITENDLVVEGAGADEQIIAIGSHLYGGVVKDSMAFEKTIELGGTDMYLRYTGCRASSMSITAATQQFVGGTFNYLGLLEAVDTAIVSGATYNPAGTNPVMAGGDMATLYVDGLASTSFCYTNLTFNLDNNLRVQNALTQLPAKGIGYGSRNITGTLSAYIENEDLYSAALNNTAVALTFELTDTSGNWYSVTLPRCKFTDRSANSTAINTDVFAELSFQAVLDPVTGMAIRVDRL